MLRSSTSLSPDDDSQEAIYVDGHHELPEQPYLLTAVFAALTALLICRGFDFSVIFGLNTTIIVGLVAYLWLTTTHQKLPLRHMAVFASILGMLLSLPNTLVYFLPWHSAGGFLVLVWSMVLAGLLGYIQSFFLKVEASPKYVLPICFFSLFVIVNIIFSFFIVL